MFYCSRFLQGSGTDADELAKIRETLAAGNNYCGRILNYKKDGTSFWNLLTIAPIKDESGKVLKFIGLVPYSFLFTRFSPLFLSFKMSPFLMGLSVDL